MKDKILMFSLIILKCEPTYSCQEVPIMQALLCFFIKNQSDVRVTSNSSLEKSVDFGINELSYHLNVHKKCPNTRCVSDSIDLNYYNNISKEMQKLGIDKNNR